MTTDKDESDNNFDVKFLFRNKYMKLFWYEVLLLVWSGVILIKFVLASDENYSVSTR